VLEEKIIEVAEELSERIMGEAAWCSREFKKNYKSHIFGRALIIRKGISKEKQRAMLFQFIFLFYHLTDRVAFGILDNDSRVAFMSILWLEIFESSFVKEKPKGMSEYRKALKKSYEDFIGRYSQYKELTRKADEGLENTLFFEFSREITKFTEHPDDIRVVYLCYALIIDALETINIKEILEVIK